MATINKAAAQAETASLASSCIAGIKLYIQAQTKSMEDAVAKQDEAAAGDSLYLIGILARHLIIARRQLDTIYVKVRPYDESVLEFAQHTPSDISAVSFANSSSRSLRRSVMFKAYRSTAPGLHFSA